MISALESDSFEMCHLVYLGISTGLYSTDYFSEISYGAYTYDASEYLLEVGSPTESQDLRVNSLTLVFSNVGQTYLSAFLNNDWLNRNATIQKAVIQNGTVVGTPIMAFSGKISGFQVSETGSTSELSVSISSHWADFQKKAGRRTNSNSQQFYFSGDLGFEYASSLVRDLKWGKK
jgi:hypothetical protein